MLPTSLEVLNFGERYDNTNKFTGGIPSEWGALTNLKSLKMVACGLDGKSPRTRAELHERQAFKSDSFAQALCLSSWGSL